jgi:hypothetical protein
MKYFRVKTGYDKNEFISIDETELPMALRAQVTGRVAIFKEGTISGNHIMSITPDYQRMKGWNRDYQLTGEDYEYIGTKMVDDFRVFLENVKLKTISGMEEKKQLHD